MSNSDVNQNSDTGKTNTEKALFVNLEDIKALHKLSSEQELELLQKMLDETKNVDDAKKISQQMIDIQAREKEEKDKESNLTGGDRMDSMIRKWAKKLQGIDTEEGIKNVAQILENQYRHLQNQVDNLATSNRATILKDIKTLEATLGNLPEFAQEALKKEIDKQYANLPKTYEDTFEFKHVNLQDEVVKFYDQLVTKDIVGVQPMTGPVGLAYALRYRKAPLRTDITKEELIKKHNDQSEYDLGKMSKYDTFEEMPHHVKESYKEKYYIEGVNDYEKEQDKLAPKEIGLVVEQKEVVARSMKVKLGHREKANSLPVARQTDACVYSTIKELKKGEEVEVEIKDTQEFIHKILGLSEEIASKTKMGAGSILVFGSEPSDEILYDLEKKAFKVIVDPILREDEIIMAHKGSRENDCGVMLCPYVPMLPTMSSDFSLSVPIKSKDADKAGLMTRFGLCDKLFGSENFYQVLKITDFEKPIED